MTLMISQPSSLPHAPGVYTFKRGKTIIYIGKAADLKKRLVSYWRKNVSDKIHAMLAEATKIEWVELESEIDALLKESELIKRHHPKYNVLMRDDKNYFYVAIRKDIFPRITLTHQPHHGDHFEYIGPFTSGAALKTALKLLRRLFPYCTCKTNHKRTCLNGQIGKCFGWCCTVGIRDEKNKNRDVYKKNITDIKNILSGKKQSLINHLKKEMQSTSDAEDFERAGQLRDQIAGLENIFLHRRIDEKILPRVRNWNKIAQTIQTLLSTPHHISRVEGYDISNISGTEATGSMVVFMNGMPAKSEYRKFKIKTVHQISDVDMLKEVVRRRLRHAEWHYPDVMLIDGGKPQLHAVLSIVGNKIPFVLGLAKREEELYTKRGGRPIRLSTLPEHTALFFQHVRNESHRFAKKYHHKLRTIAYREDASHEN